MPKKPDIAHIKSTANAQLATASRRYQEAQQRQLDYLVLRWIASMTAVEVYAVWERYAEKRLTAALVYYPQTFLADNNIRGLKSISVGLAAVLVRGSSRYFDFRSVGDLIDRGDRLLGNSQNPFRHLPASKKVYLDTLGAIRNYVVHQSESALAAYKRCLSDVYGIKSKPRPDEFLNAIDYRRDSPARRRPRIFGLIQVVEDAVNCL